MIRRQKTLLILLGPLSLMVRAAYATLPVVDYSHIAQDAGNEVVNLAKWAKTEVDQAQTEIVLYWMIWVKRPRRKLHAER
jgi:hypothetical protein